jgi:hypothetical protein
MTMLRVWASVEEFWAETRGTEADPMRMSVQMLRINSTAESVCLNPESPPGIWYYLA